MAESATLPEPATADVLPQEYKDAAAKLQEWVRQQSGLANTTVNISKGLRQMDQGDVEAEDLVRINFQDPAFVNSDVATATAQALRQKLNSIDGVRNEAVVLSPADYIDDVGNRVAELMRQAAEAGIPSGNIDVKKSPVFSSNFSSNQLKNRGTEVIESDKSTTIRLQIPTNPQHPEEAAATAEKVATNLRNRIPQIKQALIDRIKEKNYMALTPEMEQHLQAHQFKVDVVTQDNWTSVYIDIRSPEQVKYFDKPSEKVDENALKASNFFSQIPKEILPKLVGRIILFEGEKLKKPSEILVDVSGSEDMRTIVGKTMYYLKKLKPELSEKADAIMQENVFKPREQWNLPTKDQHPEKESLRFAIDPDHADTLTFVLPVPKGDAIKVATAIAAMKQETPAIPVTAPDGKLAVAGDTATTEVGAIEKAPSVAIDPAAIAAAEAAKKAKPPEGPTL
jgi:hypothetical protein